MGYEQVLHIQVLQLLRTQGATYTGATCTGASIQAPLLLHIQLLQTQALRVQLICIQGVAYRVLHIQVLRAQLLFFGCYKCYGCNILHAQLLHIQLLQIQVPHVPLMCIQGATHMRVLSLGFAYTGHSWANNVVYTVATYTSATRTIDMYTGCYTHRCRNRFLRLQAVVLLHTRLL